MGFFSRFPTARENTRVYAVIATLIYAWSVLWLFWELPSWLHYLTVGEILPLFAYALTTSLFESLLVLAGLNLLCFLLPKRWFRESFVTRGFLLVLLGIGSLMGFASLLEKEGNYPEALLLWSPAVFLLFWGLSFILDRVPLVRKLAEGIADRLTVFLYLTVPLSVLSLLVVVLRNVG